jgi:hypothetical protein
VRSYLLFIKLYCRGCRVRSEKIFEMGDPIFRPIADPSAPVRPGKVPRGTGCSLVDWIRHSQRLPRAPPRSVSKEEVMMHNSVEAGLWMVVRGFVLDCTDFAQYHPGGEAMLMLGAGKDATLLYDHYHRWVDAKAVMGDSCVVGVCPEAMAEDQRYRTELAAEAHKQT